MKLNNPTEMRGGFTLVEVLLVVAILGILAAAVAGNFGKHSVNARIRTTRASIASIETQCDIYQLDTGRYPSSLTDLIKDPGLPNWSGPYLKGAEAQMVDSWGTEFNYKASGDGYEISSAGPDLSHGTDDDLKSR